MKSHYFGLDLIRFFAALLVLFFHFGFFSWTGVGNAADVFGGVARFEGLGPYTWFGAIGVQIFFVISGFVIASSAEGSTVAKFVRGRFLRLYPCAWLCATATFIFMIGLLGSDVSALAKPYARSMSLCLWGPWIDGSYWTLPIELCFYGLVAVLLAAGSFARIHWLALLLGLTSGFFVLCGCLGIEPGLQNPVANFALRNLQFGCFFSLGLWIWISLKQRGLFTILGFAVALGGCVAEILSNFSRAIVATPVIATYFSGTTWTPLLIWTVALIGMIFASRATTATALPPVTAQFFRAIGLMTYPLYLLHDNIGTGIMRLLITAGTQPFVALVAATVLMIAASFFVSSYLEPVVRLGLTKPDWLRRPLALLVRLGKATNV